MNKKFNLKYVFLAGGIEFINYSKPISSNHNIGKILNWAFNGDENIKESFEYLNKAMSGISKLADVMYNESNWKEIVDHNGTKKGGIVKVKEASCSYAMFDVPSKLEDKFSAYQYAKLIILNIENSDQSFKITRNMIFYTNNTEGISSKDLDSFIISFVGEIIRNGKIGEQELVPEAVKEVINKLAHDALDKIKDVIDDAAKEFFEDMELEYLDLEIEGAIICAMEFSYMLLVAILFEALDRLLEDLIMFKEYSQSTFFINYSQIPFDAYLDYNRNVDTSILPATWQSDSGIPKERAVHIDQCALNFGFNLSSPKWEDLTVYRSCTVGFFLLSYSGYDSWPIATLSQVTRFDVPKEKRKISSFHNLINFSRYKKIPGLDQVTPAIDAVFNFDGDAKEYAESYGESKNLRVEKVIKQPSKSTENNFMFISELNTLRETSDHHYYNANVFADDITDKIVQGEAEKINAE